MKNFLLVLVFCFAEFSALAQAKQEGILIDEETKRPIAYASIGIVGSAKGTSSNINGQFFLNAFPGEKIKITCIGYNSIELLVPFPEVIYLKPSVTQLEEIIVTNKKVNAARVVQKALMAIKDNCIQQSFNQTFFYRHYCKDNEVYGRLIESSVEIFKKDGYKIKRTKPGQQEGIRVNQLRRSIDKTVYAMGHVPIAINSILESDINAYRTNLPLGRIDFYSDISNISSDFSSYTFSFKGITKLDGEEVYVLDFQFKRDSVQTNQGVKYLPGLMGKFFITTKSFAFVKTDLKKYWDQDTITTSTYYKKFENYYYPYHIIRNGYTIARDGSTHNFHIEFVSTEIETKNIQEFLSAEPNKFELLNIPYDSSFWNNQATLKATPIENEIIADLGGGKSLDQQFKLYRQNEFKKLQDGKLGDEGYRWFTQRNTDVPKYVIFWRSACIPCVEDIKLAVENLNENCFVLTVSVDKDSANWSYKVKELALQSSNVMQHIWVSNQTQLIEELSVKELPKYVWYSKNGKLTIKSAAKPNTLAWKEELDKLLQRDDK